MMNYPALSALRAQIDTLIRERTPIILTGGPGSGKTSLISQTAHPSPHLWVFPRTIRKNRLTASHLCDAVIHAHTGMDTYGSLERRGRIFRDALLSSDRARTCVVLVIDDAERVRSETLSDLTGIMEACLPTRPLTILLSGTATLERRISRDSALAPLSQQCYRVAVPHPDPGEYLSYHTAHHDIEIERDAVEMFSMLPPTPIYDQHLTLRSAAHLSEQIGEPISAEILSRFIGDQTAETAPHAPTRARRVA